MGCSWSLRTTATSNYLSEIRRNRRKQIAGSEIFGAPSVGNLGADMLRRFRQSAIEEKVFEYLERYDKFFPRVKGRSKGYPNAADIRDHIAVLREVMGPIQTHRDKAVAHWDKNAVRATFGDLARAFECIEYFLSDLLFCSYWTSQSMEILGGSDIEETAKFLCHEMLRMGQIRSRKNRKNQPRISQKSAKSTDAN